jgi:uncharacterized coiled-coil protein SlyX
MQKQQVLGELRNLIADHEERINAMCDHLKNVRQELVQTQVRLIYSYLYAAD